MSLSRSLPAGDVFRARLILMLADGRSYTEVQKRLNTTAPTISKWRKRFLEQRIDGLMQERHPGQKPTVITPQLQAKVLAATRRKPSDGSTHWSCRKLAKQLGFQQRRGASYLAHSRSAASPFGAIHGQQRSRFRA